MPFSKFDPYREVEDDPLDGATPTAHRRAMVLKWGTIISQAMFYMGLVILGYYWFFA